MTSPLPRLTLRRAMALVAAVTFAASALGIVGRATRGTTTTGDEPHYLVTALSLAEDGDLDVSDEIAAGRHRPFHEGGLRPQAVPRPDGTTVEPHDPLLPALLAAPTRLGGVEAAKATLALVAGTLGALVVWVLVRRFAVGLGTATVTAGVFAVAAPLAVYGHQVYPELPAALATTAGAAASTGRLRGRGLIVLWAAVVALPWLSVKYVPVAAALAGVALVRLWRRGDRLAATGVAAALAAAGVAYVVAHLVWYGGATVYASGRFFQGAGGQLSVVGTRPHYLGRAERLLGLLVDRHFGVAAWQPAWLLAVPAFAALVRRRPRGWPDLAVPLAAGWLTATFVAATMHGWWFPGRQTVVVLPLAAVAVGWWADRSRVRTGLLAVVGGLGVVTYLWLAAGAARGSLTWVVDFASTSDPWYRAWSQLLPDHLRPGVATSILHGIWLAVTSAAAVAGWRSARPVGGRVDAGPGAGGGPGPGAGTGPGPRPGGLTAAVQLPDGRAVIGAARGEGEDEGAGRDGAAQGGGGHRGAPPHRGHG